MSVQVFDCTQGTPEWFAARCGIPTASQFATVMASGRGGSESLTRRKYMLTLAGEILTETVQDGYSNAHMDRGHAMEPEARNLYAFASGLDPVQVGFIRNGNAGASPDSLVGDDGLLEIKTKLPHLQIECLLKNELPAEHAKQVHGQMWIADRQWCDFVSYWPGLPLFCIRVNRDDALIQKISDEVDYFNLELAKLVEQIRGMY